MYWFIPISSQEPMIWSADRIQMTESDARLLLEMTKSIHPKWIMLVKLSAIVADEEESACGIGSDESIQRISDLLSGSESLEWSSEVNLQLSHCGHAFFDAMLSAQEAAQFEHSTKLNGLKENSGMWKTWIEPIFDFNRKGQIVFILKEG